MCVFVSVSWSELHFLLSPGSGWVGKSNFNDILKKNFNFVGYTFVEVKKLRGGVRVKTVKNVENCLFIFILC